MADSSGVLSALDVANPARPVAVGFADTPRQVTGLAVAGRFGYLAASFDGLHVLDLTDLRRPREVAPTFLPGRAMDVAVDGRDGWNQVRRGGYDLVVTDVDMPRMTGLDLVKAIRDHEALGDLPVVIISYKDREEDRLRGLEVGANAYLTKSSFHDDRFLQVVRDLIGEG